MATSLADINTRHRVSQHAALRACGPRRSRLPAPRKLSCSIYLAAWGRDGRGANGENGEERTATWICARRQRARLGLRVEVGPSRAETDRFAARRVASGARRRVQGGASARTGAPAGRAAGGGARVRYRPAGGPRAGAPSPPRVARRLAADPAQPALGRKTVLGVTGTAASAAASNKDCGCSSKWIMFL